MNIVGIVGSAVSSGRTRKAVDLACAAAARESGDSSVFVEIIDLSVHRVSILDGRKLEDYDDDTGHAVKTIESGDLFLIGTPVYRGTYTGALKNLLDQISIKALKGKVVGLIATGASAHHYLTIDNSLRGVLAWFNAYVIPGSVYLEDGDYQNGVIDKGVGLRLAELGMTAMMAARALKNIEPLPAPLVIQLRK